MFARTSSLPILLQRQHSVAREYIGQKDYRSFFPIFQHDPTVVYLDSAATAQKPRQVLEEERNYLETTCANSGRGSYHWAYKTSKLVSSTREKVAAFIGSTTADEVVFTSGATMSLNLVALAWGEANLKDGDEILYCPSDHKSLNAPWFLLKRRLANRNIKIELKPYPLLSSGAVDVVALTNAVSPRTRLVNLTHIHNVAGVVNDIIRIRSILPPNVLINLDCAQSISHLPINVENLKVDFLSFSGHKAYSSTGIGVLWVRKNIHTQLSQVLSGGGQSDSLALDITSLSDLLECGTMNILGIVSLGAAIDFMEDIGRDVMQTHTASLTKYLYETLIAEHQIDLVYPAEVLSTVRSGVISFNVAGYSSTEVGDYLASCNIFVRHGTHCAGLGSGDNPISHGDSVRISFGLYNEFEDIDKLVRVLRSMPERSRELYQFC